MSLADYDDTHDAGQPYPCICDMCGAADFLSDEATFPSSGEHDGCTLCPSCAEEEGL